MEIGFISDIHNDVISDQYNVNNFMSHVYFDYIVLGGDIAEYHNIIKHIGQYTLWFKRIKNQCKKLIWLMGNHEFYGNRESIQEALDFYKKTFPFVKIVYSDSIKVKDTLLVFSTLWSSLENNDPLARLNCSGSNGVNDFHLIKYRNGELMSDDDYYIEHCALVENIKYELENHEYNKCIVFTHHAPSFKSINPRHESSKINGAYYSDLESLMYDYKIDYWCHGHLHTFNDYMINNTRVISNKMGIIKHISI